MDGPTTDFLSIVFQYNMWKYKNYIIFGKKIILRILKYEFSELDFLLLHQKGSQQR